MSSSVDTQLENLLQRWRDVAEVEAPSVLEDRLLRAFAKQRPRPVRPRPWSLTWALAASTFGAVILGAWWYRSLQSSEPTAPVGTDTRAVPDLRGLDRLLQARIDAAADAGSRDDELPDALWAARAQSLNLDPSPELAADIDPLEL